MRYSILATLTIAIIAKTTIAGSGFEPVISGVVDDVVNKTVSNGTINKTSDRLSKFGDVYGSAKVIPENVKEALGTKTTEVKREKKGLTFWQKIDRLIMRTRNSNY